MTVTIGERREGMVPGWWCEATVDGVRYDVGVLVIPGSGSKPDTWGIIREPGGKVRSPSSPGPATS
jgi:hypothetical protein